MGQKSELHTCESRVRRAAFGRCATRLSVVTCWCFAQMPKLKRRNTNHVVIYQCAFVHQRRPCSLTDMGVLLQTKHCRSESCQCKVRECQARAPTRLCDVYSDSRGHLLTAGIPVVCRAFQTNKNLSSVISCIQNMQKPPMRARTHTMNDGARWRSECFCHAPDMPTTALFRGSSNA